MSMDTSLRTGSSLTRHKNVLNRAERIARLKTLEKWTDGGKVLGMPKVGNRKPKAGGGSTKKKDEAAAGDAKAAAPAKK
ncbi:MAG: small basic protein [Phycisphaerae bacterium]|nr:small basic protein [Phycisphaerae bacterium]